MPAMHQFLSMILQQQWGRQELERTPEPHQVTDAAGNVAAYNQVMLSKLVVIYAAGLDVAGRAMPELAKGGRAIDLACGPGHYTLCLARHLGFEHVRGVDLSQPMVEVANRNAEELGLADRVAFEHGDVTALGAVDSDSQDFASFTGAAHHLPDIAAVGRVLREMDRITRPDGLVMVMDLVRLRTRRLTEQYLDVLGRDYVDRGLEAFLADFRDTMYAVWTADEFREAIPEDTERVWCHMVPRGLPSVQIALGLPVGRRAPLVRPAARVNPLVEEWRPRWEAEVGKAWARETAGDCRIVHWGLRTARRELIERKGAAEATAAV